MVLGTTQLGPELFMSVDENVISRQGQNYYRSCDELVLNNPHGGTTHCVKRAGHPGDIHEDMDGHTKSTGIQLTLEETDDRPHPSG